MSPPDLSRAAVEFRRERDSAAKSNGSHNSPPSNGSKDYGDCGHGRVVHEAPPKGGEVTPTMRLLDQALTTAEAEPPMRDLDGYPVQVRKREPSGLHLLTSDTANVNGGDSRPLPPPPVYTLAHHDATSMTMLIERHVEFRRKKHAVRLERGLVGDYLSYQASTLPRVEKLMTLPLVLPDGSLLSDEGLDRKRKIIFRIEPGIRALLPTGPVTKDDVREATVFLFDEWLCDVQTDDVGKFVIIALALSVIERALLDDRPTFWVTAGKRGGGKTTTLNMIAAALTGARAGAAAWSPNEEERRKAVFALLLQGAPLIIFDNIPRGTLISCPTIEKACTAPHLEDRVLGLSRTARAACATIMAFTGNNIGPKGDLASRSLTCRLDIDRPDPENRTFKHEDPIGWTFAHRQQILAALYKILLAPRSIASAKTRFKTWWRLVGSAVENAAAIASEAKVDFTKIFAEVEERDEESVTTADMLTDLQTEWPVKDFKSGDVLKAIGPTTEASIRLKAHFITARGVEPSAKFITAVLRKVVDAPVFVGNGKLILRAEKDAHHSWCFWVDDGTKKKKSPPN